ncbi:MAG: HlyC/CorC family transporter [Lachnospiraceae bacterium]|nr:HlyC/CorC family transporter [Lachnospiraceae bacterium]
MDEENGRDNFLERLFKKKRQSSEDGAAEQEIIAIVNEGQENGTIEPQEAEMIANIFELSDKEAGDIMTNRGHIVAFDDEMKLKDAVREILNNNFSRYPVYHDDLDHIIGILHLKDAVRLRDEAPKQNPTLAELGGSLREAVFVPETKTVNALFKQMQSGNTQMVIVVDEYGQTSGLVAMEDILEEIVGNIRDEYDEENDRIVASEGGETYLIEGLTKLEDLRERLDIDFGETEFETINGYLIAMMEHIPEEGDHFETDIGGYHFKVEDVKDKMITSISVVKHTAEKKSGDDN